MNTHVLAELEHESVLPEWRLEMLRLLRQAYGQVDQSIGNKKLLEYQVLAQFGQSSDWLRFEYHSPDQLVIVLPYRSLSSDSVRYAAESLAWNVPDQIRRLINAFFDVLELETRYVLYYFPEKNSN